MRSLDGTGLLKPQDGTRSAPVVSPVKDWGDRLCCGALIAMAIVFLAAIGWYVWQMPPFR
jgi:hypothetical protein